MAMSVVGEPDVPRYTPAADPPPDETYAAPVEVPLPPAPKPAKKVVVPSSHHVASKFHPLPPYVVAETLLLPPAAPCKVTVTVHPVEGALYCVPELRATPRAVPVGSTV